LSSAGLLGPLSAGPFYNISSVATSPAAGFSTDANSQPAIHAVFSINRSPGSPVLVPDDSDSSSGAAGAPTSVHLTLSVPSPAPNLASSSQGDLPLANTGSALQITVSSTLVELQPPRLTLSRADSASSASTTPVSASFQTTASSPSSTQSFAHSTSSPLGGLGFSSSASPSPVWPAPHVLQSSEGEAALMGSPPRFVISTGLTPTSPPLGLFVYGRELQRSNTDPLLSSPNVQGPPQFHAPQVTPPLSDPALSTEQPNSAIGTSSPLTAVSLTDPDPGSSKADAVDRADQLRLVSEDTLTPPPPAILAVRAPSNLEVMLRPDAEEHLTRSSDLLFTDLTSLTDLHAPPPTLALADRLLSALVPEFGTAGLSAPLAAGLLSWQAGSNGAEETRAAQAPAAFDYPPPEAPATPLVDRLDLDSATTLLPGSVQYLPLASELLVRLSVIDGAALERGLTEFLQPFQNLDTAADWQDRLPCALWLPLATALGCEVTRRWLGRRRQPGAFAVDSADAPFPWLPVWFPVWLEDEQ
jgi:hypothetical protein